jgi:hypothetical protein
MPRGKWKKINAIERVALLERTSDMLIMGKSILAISRELDTTEETAARLVKDAQIIWSKAKLPELTDEAKRILRQLDMAIFESWESWIKSKKAGEITTQTGYNAEGDIEIKTVRVSQGDPQYLTTMLKAIQMKAKIIGLDRDNINVLIQQFLNQKNTMDATIDISDLTQLREIDAAIYAETVSDDVPSGIRPA